MVSPWRVSSLMALRMAVLASKPPVLTWSHARSSTSRNRPPLSRAVVDTEHVVIRECGFTNFLLKFEEEYISRRSGPVKERRDLYYSMIVYLSNNSFLNDRTDVRIYRVDEMTEHFHIGIPNQITAISKICEYPLEELEPLKYICSVRMGKRIFQSELTKAQRELIERLGIEENEIR